jgi:hypothetical protein
MKYVHATGYITAAMLLSANCYRPQPRVQSPVSYRNVQCSVICYAPVETTRFVFICIFAAFGCVAHLEPGCGRDILIAIRILKTCVNVIWVLDGEVGEMACFVSRLHQNLH